MSDLKNDNTIVENKFEFDNNVESVIEELENNQDLNKIVNELKLVKQAFERYKKRLDFNYAFYGITKSSTDLHNVNALYMNKFTKESIDQRFELFYKNELKLCVMNNILKLDSVLNFK